MARTYARTFRVQAAANGLFTLSFQSFDGRTQEVVFPAAGALMMINHLQAAVTQAPAPQILHKHKGQSRIELGSKKLIDQLKAPRDSSRPGFELGTTADLEKVWLRFSVPSSTPGRIDSLEATLPPEDARVLLKGIADMLTLIETDHAKTEQ